MLGGKKIRVAGTKATAARPEQRLRLLVPSSFPPKLLTGLDADRCGVGLEYLSGWMEADGSLRV